MAKRNFNVQSAKLLTALVSLVLLVAKGQDDIRQIPGSEYSALVDLYNSTDGAHWTVNTGWFDPSATEWYGVQLSGQDTAGFEHVVGIDLQFNNLYGTIPPSLDGICGYSTNSYLALEYNGLQGTIPYLPSLKGGLQVNDNWLDVGPQTVANELGMIANGARILADHQAYIQASQVSETGDTNFPIFLVVDIEGVGNFGLFPVPVSTTADLYWSDGPQFANILSSTPVWTLDIPAGPRTNDLYDGFVPASALTNPPAGATTLLLVADPDNLVTAPNWSLKSFSFPLPSDLATVSNSLAWDDSNGGLNITYTNAGYPLQMDTSAQLFWATSNYIIGTNAIFTADIPVGFTGQVTVHVPESYLESPPPNATFLVLLLDPYDLVEETTKANNVFSLANTFRHVVLVMMENRSFDHLLGWLNGANGAQSGRTFPNGSGQQVPTFPLAPYFQGCGCNLPDQTFGAPGVYNNGAWNGWLIANPSDNYTVGYYTQADLPFFGQVAPNWTVCDNYHAALLAETQPNRIYQHAAQTDALQNRDGLGFLNYVTLRTIWDSLSDNSISGRYYYSPIPAVGRGWAGSTLALWGGPLAYSGISGTIGQFVQDCESGNLPAVSFVDPLFTAVEDSSFVGLGDTAGNDDHPHSHIWNGESLLASIYNSIIGSPQWSSTVLIINFDEWGGFYDHEPPPYPPGWNGNVPTADQGAYSNAGISSTNVAYGRLGFRVPCIVISPWSRNGTSQKGPVNHELFDHCSVLKND